MKSILLASIATLALSTLPVLADNYSVFRVCEDQHVLRTSDGAEAGHVEYIVVEPSSQRVVSAVVTGGVGADRHVAVPISAMRFGAEREITLTRISREQIISAPVVETTRFTTSSFIEPASIERTYTHFGYDPREITRTSTSTTVSGGTYDRTSVNANVDQTTNVDRTSVRGNVNVPNGPDGRANDGRPDSRMPNDRNNDSQNRDANAANRDAARAGRNNAEAGRGANPNANDPGPQGEAKGASDAAGRAEKAPRAGGPQGDAAKMPDRDANGATDAGTSPDAKGRATGASPTKGNKPAANSAEAARNAAAKGEEKVDRTTEKAAGKVNKTETKAVDKTERATEKTSRKADTEGESPRTGGGAAPAGTTTRKVAE